MGGPGTLLGPTSTKSFPSIHLMPRAAVLKGWRPRAMATPSVAGGGGAGEGPPWGCSPISQNNYPHLPGAFQRPLVRPAPTLLE